MTTEQKDAIADRLADLYREHGQLTPTIVVAEAANPRSPLHDQFEWNDSAAAARWREEQARRLIRSIHVVVRTDTMTVRAVAYVRDPAAKSDEQGYVSIESLQRDPVEARNALEYECGRAEAVLARVRHLAFALGFAGEIDAILSDISSLRERATA